MKYLLDTNTIIYFFKDSGKVTANLFKQCPEQVAMPAIVLYELQVGILKSTDPTKRIKQLTSLLNDIDVIPFTEKTAYYAAQIRKDLEQKGTPIGDCDILIAAIAMEHQATLVTHNTREFSRVENLEITDWF